MIASLPYDLVIDELGSTNDYARKMGEETAPHGSWISASRQTAGRGRLGREWSSLTGNLFLSIVLRPEKTFPMTWVPLAVALGVFRAAKRAQPDWDLVLKWPNDLGIRDRKVGFRKIGGILCEGVGGAGGSFIIAGVGVNCAIAPDTDQPTAALGVAVDGFRLNVIREVLDVLGDPLSSIRREYERASLLCEGDAIEWKDLRENISKRGEFAGYGENGELLARPSESFTGEVERLFSEEIKLLFKRSV
ncbi:MAG: biotin--[acetyl-CoA-carboxylase] ligase [Cryobacterium sp.]|nr:biotin--[acetyl-CoA-carboxylase] ligase [Oligoflexia bacterium]